MAYSAEISRTNPTCFMFLVDRSSSMLEPFGAQPDKSKSDGVADAINRLLQNLALKCAKSDGIRDYFHVGVIGYGVRAEAGFGGALAGKNLVPISELANNPLRVEERKRTVDDGAGGLIERSFKFPVWFEPKAVGKTPMCQALTMAAQAVKGFVATYPNSYPALVINITDGKATDGDPRPVAEAIKKMATSDGNVMLFNAHISAVPAVPIAFPSSDNMLPDVDSKLLFSMSSELPAKFLAAAQSEGFSVQNHARGFVFNGDLVSIIRFLDIGTRVAAVR